MSSYSAAKRQTKIDKAIKQGRFLAWAKYYAKMGMNSNVPWSSKEKWLAESIKEIGRLADFKFKNIRELENALKCIWYNYVNAGSPQAPFCRVCGLPINFKEDSVHWHHISYAPAKIIPLHQSCHYKVHHGTECPELVPPGCSNVRGK